MGSLDCEGSMGIYSSGGGADMERPGEVLKQIFEDNAAFASLKGERVGELTQGQNPEITAVFCSDSRVNEQAFAKEPLNHLFVIQNAGNLARVNAGSVWYGVEHLHSKVLAVIGHTGCGAVYAAMDASREDDLPEDLSQIFRVVSENPEGREFKDRVKQNAYYVEKNVDSEIRWLLGQDWVKHEMKSGMIIVGMVYEIAPVIVGSGKLRLINYNGKGYEEVLKHLSVPYGRISPP